MLQYDQVISHSIDLTVHHFVYTHTHTHTHTVTCAYIDKYTWVKLLEFFFDLAWIIEDKAYLSYAQANVQVQQKP